MFSSVFFVILQMVIIISEKKIKIWPPFAKIKNKFDFFSNLDPFYFYVNHLVKKLRFFPIKYQNFRMAFFLFVLEQLCDEWDRMLRRSLGRATVRYRLHAGEPVEHRQANFLYYAVSVAALCIYRVGTVIVKLQVIKANIWLNLIRKPCSIVAIQEWLSLEKYFFAI